MKDIDITEQLVIFISFFRFYCFLIFLQYIKSIIMPSRNTSPTMAMAQSIKKFSGKNVIIGSVL